MPVQVIHLIRDGESEWSLSGWHTGVSCIPLTKRGRYVARQLEPVLARKSRT
jgi:broad specificity phosphatase PhoE